MWSGGCRRNAPVMDDAEYTPRDQEGRGGKRREEGREKIGEREDGRRERRVKEGRGEKKGERK